MLVTLDGEPAVFGWSGARSLGELVSRAEAVSARGGRAVVAVSADGCELSLAARDAWAPRSLEGLSQVALRTAGRRDLLRETLDELRGHLPVLRERLEAAAGAFRSGRERDALAAVEQAATLWQACLEVVQAVGGDLVQGDLAGRLDRLKLAVQPLDEALRRRDLVLVADLCAYELPPLVDQWEEAVDALRLAAAESP